MNLNQYKRNRGKTLETSMNLNQYKRLDPKIEVSCIVIHDHWIIGINLLFSREIEVKHSKFSYFTAFDR